MRFRKMVIGITNAPLPSGDGKVVDGLTLGDLKTIKQTVALLNLKTNTAVHEACGCLDDQEGRAFLAADVIGVELVRGMSHEGNSRCWTTNERGPTRAEGSTGTHSTLSR